MTDRQTHEVTSSSISALATLPTKGWRLVAAVCQSSGSTVLFWERPIHPPELVASAAWGEAQPAFTPPSTTLSGSPDTSTLTAATAHHHEPGQFDPLLAVRGAFVDPEVERLISEAIRFWIDAHPGAFTDAPAITRARMSELADAIDNDSWLVLSTTSPEGA